MSKSLYSEFPTNAHAHGYGMWKVREPIAMVMLRIAAGEKV